MNNRNIMLVLIAVILLVGSLVGYGLYVNVASNAHVEKLAAAQYSRVIGARAIFRDIAPVLEIPALYLQSSWMLDVNVKLEGTVSRLHVNPGDQVKAGQLLGELVNDELPAQILQAEGKINEARANWVKYNNTLARYQSLVNAAGISKQQLDEAIANQAAGAAMVMSAEATRDQLLSRLAGQKIFAPRDGDILKLYTKEGAFMRAGEAMVMIGDFATLSARENMRQEVLENCFRWIRLSNWYCRKTARSANPTLPITAKRARLANSVSRSGWIKSIRRWKSRPPTVRWFGRSRTRVVCWNRVRITGPKFMALKNAAL